MAEAFLYGVLFGIVLVKCVDRYILLFALAYMPIYSASVLAVNWVEYEAELGSRSSGTVDTDHIGYTGTGYVNVNTGIGEWVEITVNVPGDADYDISLRYALSENTALLPRPAQVTVEGVEQIASLDFATGAFWSVWLTVDFSLTLTAGDNAIRFTSLEVGGLGNFDRLDVDVDVDFMYWGTNFNPDPIVLPNLTSQGQIEAASSTITLVLNGNAEISANNTASGPAELSSATDVLVTEYKLTYDGGDTGGDTVDWTPYNTFLSTASSVTYYTDDYTVDVTLHVRASNSLDNVADAGAYSAVQTLTVSWVGP